MKVTNYKAICYNKLFLAPDPKIISPETKSNVSCGDVQLTLLRISFNHLRRQRKSKGQTIIIILRVWTSCSCIAEKNNHSLRPVRKHRQRNQEERSEKTFIFLEKLIFPLEGIQKKTSELFHLNLGQSSISNYTLLPALWRSVWQVYCLCQMFI